MKKNNSARVAIFTAFSSVLSAPAMADGFSKANTLLQTISTGLAGLAVVVITIAVLWVGYKVLWNKQALSECSNIIIGGILIASASAIGSMLTS